MRAWGTVVMFGGMIACRKVEGVASTDAMEAESFEALRESARATLEANCADCHEPGSGTALPRALAVYNLMETDWYARMTDAQLKEALRRLNEPLAPTRGEGEVRPLRVTAEEKARFTRFVEAVAERRTSPRRE
jgi:hypothetical protein